MRTLLKNLIFLLLAMVGTAQAADDAAFAVIAHPGVAHIDAATLQRLYTGRAIEAGGAPVNVCNLAPGVAPRERFLAQVVSLDNDRYVAYWTVRRHIGKGVPPREFRTAGELIEYVQSTPGAIGYVAVARPQARVGRRLPAVR